MKEQVQVSHLFTLLSRLRVVPHFSSGIVERAKRERAWKSPHARKAIRGGEREKMISFFSLPPRVAFSRVGWFSGALAFRYPGYQRFFLACDGELRFVGRSEKVTYYLDLIRVIKEKVVVSACKENHFYRSQHLRPPFAFTSSTKRENKHFHVVVVQWRQRNVQKSVMHVRALTF